MEIETESEQTNEPFLNVGEENIEESEQRAEQLVIEALGDEGEDILLQDDATAEDLYNFNVSVALTEIQSDEMDSNLLKLYTKLTGRGFIHVASARKYASLKGA